LWESGFQLVNRLTHPAVSVLVGRVVLARNGLLADCIPESRHHEPSQPEIVEAAPVLRPIEAGELCTADIIDVAWFDPPTRRAILLRLSQKQHLNSVGD